MTCRIKYQNNQEIEADKIKFERVKSIIKNANFIHSIAGDAPHDDFRKYTGYWRVTGQNVLPNSYFYTIVPQ